MALIREFLSEIDARWKPLGGEPITLQTIGSAALMLQCDYARGTKDGDILGSATLGQAAEDQLLSLAGKGADIFAQFRIYVDIVRSAILFAPQTLIFHPVSDLKLRNFSIEALDATDVAVSKLKRFKPDDIADIREMAKRGFIEHKRLISRFEAAMDFLSTSAQAEDFPRYISKLRIVERDILGVPPADIELPLWMQD
ncbi:MAG: hypothetical protein HY924_10235 [Elusimicrobia bacterium]|nr:hypothetical protein [Elusimicrobiota bacterium]